MNAMAMQEQLAGGNSTPPDPIPGYKLVERIGCGGYGEVWKVLAPGGVSKAIKLIYGDDCGWRRNSARSIA